MIDKEGFRILQGNELEESGQVIVHTGLGKGKTTAALGLAYRALGHGWRVVFICFTGPEYPQMGDVRAATALGGNLRMIGVESQARDVSYLADFAESTPTAETALDLAREVLIQGKCDLLVLDDINPLLYEGTIDTAQVVALIDEKPPNATIVLTGRFAPQAIIERADTVTDFAEIKHPSQAGIEPRKGVDF
ncbi:MAG: cob(I)yrinic acid a,c-diamide adenosyltransferase [Anaerolineae bacterium]